MSEGKGHVRKALKAAFPHTIPILMGYMFLGISYGIYMTTAGLPVWLTVLVSIVVYAGALQFIGVGILSSAFNPLQTLIMALTINARHLFYSISMLDKYKGAGKKKAYMIFGMVDETFSINYGAKPPESVDKHWFMFFVTLLNQGYWILGASVGAIFASAIKFNTKGIDFVMTAMFVVIFLEQWQREKNHTSALIGLGVSLTCLLIFGTNNFIIPSMIAIIALLTFMRRPLEKAVKEEKP